MQTLAAGAEHVFVAAAPPIGPWATGRGPVATIAFSERLRTLCERGGFTFFNLFAGIRNGETGFARAGLHRDAFHMADYPGLAKDVLRLVGLRVALFQAPTVRTALAASILTQDRYHQASSRTFGTADSRI